MFVVQVILSAFSDLGFTVFVVQVARALLDDRSSSRLNSIGPSDRVPLSTSHSITNQQLHRLQTLHEQHMLVTIRNAMQTAAANVAAAGQKAAAAAAAQAAFDDNLDLVVELGWAHVEKLCLGYMLEEARTAPAGAAAGIAALAQLYGATRIEKRAAR